MYVYSKAMQTLKAVSKYRKRNKKITVSFKPPNGDKVLMFGFPTCKLSIVSIL